MSPERDPGQIPRWVSRLVIRIFIAAIALAFAWAMFPRLGDFLFTIFIAFFLSLALEPAVKWLADRGWKRGIATATVMSAVGLFGLVLVALLVPAVIKQIIALIQALPGWLEELSAKLNEWFGWDLSPGAITDQLKNVDASMAKVAGNVAGSVLGVGAAILSGVFRLMTIALFTFYFVADGPRFRRSMLSVLTSERQRQVLAAYDVAIEKTGGYLYSRLLLAIVSGFVSWLVMRSLGVPFAMPLAIWVGIISQFIPTVGTYIAMFVPIVVALFTDPMDALWLLIFFTAYQQFENYVLSPKITAKTMELHPAIAFASAIIGGTLFGPIGAFLALPVVATIQSGVLVYLIERHEVVEDELTQLPPEPAPKPIDEVSIADDLSARWRRLRGKR